MDERQAHTMKPARPHTNRTSLVVSAALAFFSFAAVCLGQGTMTITFDSGYPVVPPGGRMPGAYTESGMNFWNPYGEQSPILAGGGIAGYPEDGTADLRSPLVQTSGSTLLPEHTSTCCHSTQPDTTPAYQVRLWK